MNISAFFVAASALLMGVLGVLHLYYTFQTTKFDPRDPSLKLHMQGVAPGISSHTTVWRCWVGFNASHSLGVILYAVVYGYLALAPGLPLFKSPFLLVVGALLLAAYAALARLFWFHIPLRGILAAAALYALGLITWYA